jgi:hypothetical protein
MIARDADASVMYLNPQVWAPVSAANKDAANRLRVLDGVAD